MSNFQSKQLEAVVATATIPPAVDQMQMYVGCKAAWCATNNATIETCRRHGINWQVYSPLGHGKALENPAVKQIGAARNVSAAQVALRFRFVDIKVSAAVAEVDPRVRVSPKDAPQLKQRRTPQSTKKEKKV